LKPAIARHAELQARSPANVHAMGRRGAVSASVFAALAALVATAGMLTSPLVEAQVNFTGDTTMDSSGNAGHERAWCMVNTEGEARVDCLKSSGAAQAEKRRGTLDNNGGNYTANALMRCNVFMGQELAACKVRVLGYGDSSGSVQGGGIIKQVETVEVPSGRNTIVVQPNAPSLMLVVPGEKR